MFAPLWGPLFAIVAVGYIENFKEELNLFRWQHSLMKRLKFFKK